MIRLAVRVARADAETVLAELLELAPGGLEERELRRRRGRVRPLRRARRAARRCGDAARGGRRRARRRLHERGARRLVGALEGVPPARRRELALPAPARAAAVGGAARRRRHRPRDRPRAGVRHRRAPHDAPVPASCCSSSSPPARSPTGAAARACWRSRPRGSAGTRCSRATGRRRRSRRRARTRRVNGAPGVAVERVDLRARRGPVGADRGRQPRPAAAARRRGADDAGRRATLIVSGLLREEADEVAAAFARHGLREAGPAPRRRVGALLLGRGSLGRMAWNVLILGGGLRRPDRGPAPRAQAAPAQRQGDAGQRRQLHALHAAAAGRGGRHAGAAPRRRPAARAAAPHRAAPRARARRRPGAQGRARPLDPRRRRRSCPTTS